MNPEAEAKRRQSIAYILRRRKRGRRIGANSGATVKSVQQKIRGHLVFTPTGGSVPWWQRLMWLIAIPLAMLIVFVPTYLIGLHLDDPQPQFGGYPPHAWLIFGMLGVVSAGVIGFSAAYFAINLWRAIRRLYPHRNE